MSNSADDLVVMTHPSRPRVELSTSANELVVVTEGPAGDARRARFDYGDPSDLERALKARVRALTEEGYTRVADATAATRPVRDAIPGHLSEGLEELAPQLEPWERRHATWLPDFERSAITAVLRPSLRVSRVRAFHRWVVERAVRTVVLDGDVHRLTEQFERLPGTSADTQNLLAAWVEALARDPGNVQELVFRHCDLDSLDLDDRLRPFSALAFVACAPRDFACAARATHLTLACREPSDALSARTLSALAGASLSVESSSIVATGRGGVASSRALDDLDRGLARLMSAKTMPRLRSLSIAGVSASSFLARLVASPLGKQLGHVRIDARVDRSDLAWIAGHAASLAHFDRVELYPLPGSVPLDDVDLQGVEILRGAPRPVRLY